MKLFWSLGGVCLFVCTSMVVSRGAMASLGPRSNLLQETQVGSASGAGFVASSDLCVAPEVCYHRPGLTTVKPAGIPGVPDCNAATTTSVLTAVSVHGLKPYCFFCERNKSPPSRLFSRSEIKDDITRWRGFDANTRSLSFNHCESRLCKQRWQKHFSRTLSPLHAELWPRPSCICHFFGSLLTQRSCQRSA